MEEEKPEEYRILVLPGGGATGVTTLTTLAQLEKDTGKRIFELFNEIQCASIGSLIGALLTIPQQKTCEPMTAQEILNFLEEEVFGSYLPLGQKFIGYLKPIGIRGKFRKKLRTCAENEWLMSDTLIPLRILTAEVRVWQARCIPKEADFRGFCSDDENVIYLSDVVCASCNVFALWPCTEQIRPLSSERCFIDAGLVGRMDPRRQFSQECSGKTVYFIGNGFANDYFDMADVALKYSINFELKPVFDEWKTQTWIGWACHGSDYRNCNLAGIGLVSTDRIKKAAEDIAESPEYQAMHSRLMATVRADRAK